MIYIDLLLVEDFLFNYHIIVGTSIILNRITTLKKSLFSSIIGILPTITLIISKNHFYQIIVSFLFQIIISIISFNYKSFIYTIKNVIYMNIISVFIAGSISLMNINCFPNINNYLFRFIILIIIFPILTYIYLKSISKIKTNYSNYYKVDIYFNNQQKISVISYLDTGNKLSDPYLQKPIILLNKNLVKEINNPIFVPYNTVNSHSLMTCIKAKKIYIDKVGYRTKFLIGLVDTINLEGVECILNSKLLERIN